MRFSWFAARDLFVPYVSGGFGFFGPLVSAGDVIGHRVVKVGAAAQSRDARDSVLARQRLSGSTPPMTYVMVDIEADGPIPGDYSMVCFGAVIVEPGLSRTFYATLRPISDAWVPEALAVSGFSREQTLAFPAPAEEMTRFRDWLNTECPKRRLFISDNNGFDWQFINWYFHHFLGGNPFGFSSSNLGSLYKGLVKDTFKNFKHLRKTKHTHNPVDDAMGNAEALLRMKQDLGLKMQT
ncbi:MAG: exonuclease domain-containing protein [Myxococcales bacterium]|nr:exonuclease domain-containing protein [Myxococcales bacterium]